MKLVRINLQQCLVFNERYNTVLAASSSHNDAIYFNKPMIDSNERNEIKRLLIDNDAVTKNFLSFNTDSFSVAAWNPVTQTNIVI